MKRMWKKILISSIFLIIFSALNLTAKIDAKGFTVVIDAGHGGKDHGAVDNGTNEKSINLGVALELQKLLEKRLKDIKIVMTRDDDSYLTLQERADIANKSKGNLFISIHTNSVDKSNKNRKNISGASVYALGLHKDENNMRVARRENAVIELEQNFEQKYSGFDPQKDESYIIFEMAQKKNLSKSIRFANEVQNRLVNSGRKNRGVHQAGFWVLWATSMPSVLVELDFICNPTSASYLSSAKGQKELAEAICGAVEHYVDGYAQSAVTSKVTVAGKETEIQEREYGKSESMPPTLASTRNVVKKTSNGSAETSATYYNGKRRRRSDLSRQNSSERNVETDNIVVHREEERHGQLEKSEEVPEPTIVEEPKIELTKEQKKANKKREKEERKIREKEKKRERPQNAHNAKVGKVVTVYKIQVLATNELLRQNNARFCGLTPISTYKENNMYKYYYGESQDRAEIDALLKEVKKKIPDAFVVSSLKSTNVDKK